MGEGTLRRDWRRIAEEAEDRGVSLSTSAGYAVQGIAVDARIEDWEVALEWAAELAREASFPEERCRWVCQQTAAELESLADQPEVRTGWEFLDQLYPNHPLGRPLHGSRESLAALTAEACRTYHRDCLERGVIVTAAGLIEPDAVERKIELLFGDLTAAGRGAPRVPDPDAGRAEIREVALGRGDQAHLFLGKLTERRSSADFGALLLLGVVLGSGSGLGGRIPHRVRELEGLAYSCQVDTVAGSGLDRGRLAVYLGTSVDEVQRAHTAAVQELERLVDRGISDSEVEEARRYLLGREPFRRETARQWTRILAERVLLDLPLDDPDWVAEEVSEVGRSEVEEASRRLLGAGDLEVTFGLPSGSTSEPMRKG
jgi:zinc protease